MMVKIQMNTHAVFLKSFYKLILTQTSRPPSTTNTIFRLTLIKTTQVRRGELDVQMSNNNVKHQIELENIFEDTSNKRKVVLIEGAPGSGKSTLCVHICQEWENNQLFREFTLVILIQL